MKLYSRHQVLAAVLVTAFVVCAVCGTLFWAQTRGAENNVATADGSDVRGGSANGTGADGAGLHGSLDADALFAEGDESGALGGIGSSGSFAFQQSPYPAATLVDTRDGYTQDELQNISVYEKCQSAVVNITTEVVGINWFLEPVSQEGGSGSGAIIDKRGYVVTNTHVISDAYRVYVSLSDGTQYEGTVVGSDAASDIAVVKFNPPANVALNTISFGDSARLKVGQKVIAIGNPFGFERTMTTGIVSGLGRPIQTSANTIIRDMIQTDTAINPGNSGGPLLDTQGRIIGINTMIYSTSGSSAGIGFAVPVNTAKRVVAELIQNGVVARGSLDLSFIQLNASIANYAKLNVTSGLLVQEVAKNSNADKAGIRGGTEAVRYGSRRSSQVIYLGGDVITGIDGIRIASLADYYSALESKKPGDIVTVTVQRGRKELELKIVLTSAER